MDLLEISDEEIIDEKVHRKDVPLVEIGKVIAEKAERMKYYGEQGFTADELIEIRDQIKALLIGRYV